MSNCYSQWRGFLAEHTDKSSRELLSQAREEDDA